MAHKAAKTMSELGLKADEQEAKIGEIYSKTLKNLVEAGIASAENAMEAAQQIEDNFIDAKGGNSGRQIPANNPSPVGPMAGGPSNPSI